MRSVDSLVADPCHLVDSFVTLNIVHSKTLPLGLSLKELLKVFGLN